MSRINDELLNKILLTIIAFILFIILVGTIYALAARKKNTPQNPNLRKIVKRLIIMHVKTKHYLWKCLG